MEKQLKYCKILGTNINVTTMNDTIKYLEDNLKQLSGNYICVSNVHTTVMAFRNEEYQRIQNSGAMALPDGLPLSIVSRKRGFSNAKRVPGPDLMPNILEISLKKGYRHFFYGGSEETITGLREVLQHNYPGLLISGMYSPPFRTLTEEEDCKIVQLINQSKPDFVWIALGAPKQEIWMNEHKNKIEGLMIGVGAAFSFMAGTTKRAPQWMQNLCLEWLYRIGQDPWRMLPRYLNTNFTFIWEVWRENKRAEKPFRIAMIGHKRIPSREGGVEVVVEELSTRMVIAGCVVEAYNRSGYHVSGKEYSVDCGKDYKKIRLITIPTFRYGKLNAIVYAFLATLRALFGKYDVIHYHAEGPCIMLWIPKLFGIRIIATIHGLDWQRAKWGNFASRVLKCGEKMAVKHADEVIVLSKNVQNYFMTHYARNCSYIPNGISRPLIVEPNLITEKYGLPKDGYILFLARVVPEKGLHYLIEAYAEIETDKKLVIAGGNSNSYEYMEHIRKMVDMDSRITMTNFVQGRILEELYSNAYLFVLPSDIEGMSLSLLEAMSYGNCCVVSDIDENLEVVEDKAISFAKGDVENLKSKLCFLLDHPDIVLDYKSISQNFICEKYSWNKVVEETMKLYKGK